MSDLYQNCYLILKFAPLLFGQPRNHNQSTVGPQEELHGPSGWSSRDRIRAHGGRRSKSCSHPDSKQKTETELTFWYVLPYFVHSEPFQSKQKQKQVCTSHIWICDHLWPKSDQNVTKSALLKKLKKIRACDRGHKFKIVTFCDRHKCHTLSVTGTNPASVSVWNPDRNGSKDLRVL